ncbi:hypothetical protein IFM89_018806 [Coptis chinensis]|uniref:WRC domain-containing protein n=1 Tax=Coptis chinensis TaxID=261450 RepID=A0A835LC61_9MAGN|nr:hypothetical protein IFM89_018806 [Coptis chinensis]
MTKNKQGDNGAVPPPESRCVRNDGRKWRCKGWVYEESTLCEKHYLYDLQRKFGDVVVREKRVQKTVKRKTKKRNESDEDEDEEKRREDERVRKRAKRSLDSSGLVREEEEEMGAKKKGIDAILRDSESTESDYTASELIISLKTAFRFKDFEEVAQIIKVREGKMKMDKEVVESRCVKLSNEIEVKKTEIVDVREKLQEMEVRKIGLEDEIWGHKRMCNELKEKVIRLEEDYKVVCERERRSQVRIVTLSDELKKMNKNEREILVVLKKENSDLEYAKRRVENEIEVWKRRINELETNRGMKTVSLPQVKIKEEGANCDAKRSAENKIEVPKRRFREQATNCGLKSAGFPKVNVKEEALNCDPKVYASANSDFACPFSAKAGRVTQLAEEGKKNETIQRVTPTEFNNTGKGISLSHANIRKEEDEISKFLSEFRKLKGNN